MITIDLTTGVARLKGATKEEKQRLARAYAYRRPEFIAAVRRGGRTFGLREWGTLVERDGDDVLLPAASVYRIRELVGPCDVIRNTVAGEHFDWTLRKPVFPYQHKLAANLAAHDCGIIVAPPGAGKTVVIAALLVMLQMSSLIIVPTVDIVNQFATTIRDFLGVEASVLADGRVEIGSITICTPQSGLRHVEKIRHRFAVVVVDEVHTAAGETIRRLLNMLDAPRRYGCTGTPHRIDGLWPICVAFLGPIRGRLERPEMVDMGRLMRATYRQVVTDFDFSYGGADDWADLQAAIVEDERRNRLIVDSVVRESAGHSSLILTGRVSHAVLLEGMLVDRGLRAKALYGAMPRKARAQALDDARAGRVDVLVATSLADQGLDVPALSRLFLVFPQRCEPRFVQRVGRVIRCHESKDDALVFDFVDDRVGVLRWQAEQRRRSFQKHFQQEAA
jgi:superfamily II DNA or RNA helicase